MTIFKSSLTVLAVVFATDLAGTEAPRFSHDHPVPWAVRSYIDRDLLTWVNAAQIVTAIRAQNQYHAGLTPAEIRARELDWQAQRHRARRPLIEGILETPLSDYLRREVARSRGWITEVIVMDAHGLTVAASAEPSDYWQGDEDKFTRSFVEGPGAIFVGEIQFDDSTQTYQSQVSLAVTDPSTGQVIGAITVGLAAAVMF